MFEVVMAMRNEDIDGEEHLTDQGGQAAVPGRDLQLVAGSLLPVQWSRCFQVKVGHLNQKDVILYKLWLMKETQTLIRLLHNCP